LSDLVTTFQAFSGILVICPCCGELLRVSDLQFRFAGEFDQTVLDELRRRERGVEKGQEALERKIKQFEDGESALRSEAKKRGREQMRQLVRELDPGLARLQYDPKDIKVIGHPVDLVVFDGLNSDSGTVKNIIFVARNRSKSTKIARKTLAKAIETGQYLWETVTVGMDGKVVVQRTEK